MTGQTASSPLGHRVILWTARIMATLIVLFSVTMIIAYAVDPFDAPPESFELVLLAFFPVGMCVGYLLAWRWPLTGGIVSLACLVVFLVALGEADMILTITFLSIPGVLFTVYGILTRGLRVAPSIE